MEREGNSICFFLAFSTNSDEWMCRCGSKRMNSGFGNTNLVLHVQSQYLSEYQGIMSDPVLSINSPSVHGNIFQTEDISSAIEDLPDS